MMSSTTSGIRPSNQNPSRRRRSENVTHATVSSNTPKSAYKALSKENTTPPRRRSSKGINMNSYLTDEYAPATQVKVSQHKKEPKGIDKINVKIENSLKKTSPAATKTATKTMSPLKDECIKLLRAKQFRSCEIMTMFYLSSISSASNDLSIYAHKATAYEILGDCVLNQNQLNRAVSFYKKALSNLKCLRSPTSSSSLRNILHIHTAAEANVKLKEARALFKLGNISETTSILESAVPRSHPLRTFAISMEIGGMYLASGRYSDAKLSYLDALGRNSYALEAIENLVFLNAERSEVMKAVNDGLQKHNEKNGKENIVDNDVPIADIITAYFYSDRQTNSHQMNALSQWKKLHAKYPLNIHVLLQMALLQDKNPACDNAHAAVATFQKIRALDYHFVEGMDTYASLLAKQCNVAELGRLSSDLLTVDDKRPEAWVALALYHEALGDSEKAIAFVEKGISFDERNAFCHKLKGSILLSQGRPDIAGSCFFRANEIKREIASYEGLVESCLRAKKYKEAICTAKEAMSFAPRDSRALTLVGLALSKATSSSRDSGGKDRAKKALRKAIALDPLALRPLLALSDLYIADSEFDTCIDLVKKAIEDGGDANLTGTSPVLSNVYDRQVVLHAKLADAYGESKNFEEALTYYHKTLSMNPGCLEAQRGVEQMENAMKGFNPKLNENDDGYNYTDYNDA